jgi:hypothetical protein
MRGFGYFGGHRRNDPIKLENPHPVFDYGSSDVYSGDVGKDGYERLSLANPNAQGNPPPVKGTVGQVYQGPDQSFEQ